jgi:hypothetical protein
MKVHFLDGTALVIKNGTVFLDIKLIVGTFNNKKVTIPLTSVKYWEEQ